MSTTPTSVFGSRINLISHRRVRYEGILSAIDAEKQTVTLHNVRLHGTEGRAALLNLPEIQGTDDIYEYIIFNRQDIYNLSVIESPPPPEQPRFPSAGYGYGYSYPFPSYGGYYPPQQSFAPYMYPPAGGGASFYPVPQSATIPTQLPIPPFGSVSTNDISSPSVASVPAPIPIVLPPPIPVPAMVPPYVSSPAPFPTITDREPRPHEIPIAVTRIEREPEYEPTLPPSGQKNISAIDRKRTGPAESGILPSHTITSTLPVVKQETRSRRSRERPPRQTPTQFDTNSPKEPQYVLHPPSPVPFSTPINVQINGRHPTSRTAIKTEQPAKQYDIQAANREFIKEVGLLTDRIKNLETTRSKDFFDHFSTEESEIRYNNAATFGFIRGRGGRRGRGRGGPSHRGGRGTWGSGGGLRHPINSPRDN